jgi:hypothetical protein
MKYIRKFNEDNIEERSIRDWCKLLNIKYYRISKKGLVSANDCVRLARKKLDEIPIKFGIVNGFFECNSNKLTSLKGAPMKVSSTFNCSSNNLTSLEYGPKIVGGSFWCEYNDLTTLEYGPDEVGGSYYCETNKLLSLKGSPNEINEYFICSYNKLTSLEGAPKKVDHGFQCGFNDLTSLEGCPEKVGGHFYCDHNPIHNVYKLFGSLESYKASLDYKYLRGTNIIKRRFEVACKDAGIKMPYYAPDKYEYIDL